MIQQQMGGCGGSGYGCDHGCGDRQSPSIIALQPSSVQMNLKEIICIRVKSVVNYVMGSNILKF